MNFNLQDQYFKLEKKKNKFHRVMKSKLALQCPRAKMYLPTMNKTPPRVCRPEPVAAQSLPPPGACRRLEPAARSLPPPGACRRLEPAAARSLPPPGACRRPEPHKRNKWPKWKPHHSWKLNEIKSNKKNTLNILQQIRGHKGHKEWHKKF